MRIISKNPIEIIRGLVQNDLGYIWTHQEQLKSLLDGTAKTGNISYFREPECRTLVEPLTFTTRLACYSSQAEGAYPEYYVLAGIGPSFGGDIELLLTSELDVLCAVQTEIGERPDGITQIATDDTGIALLTIKEVLAQRGKALMRGTTLRAFALEQRDGSAWKACANTITIPASAGPRIELEE